MKIWYKCILIFMLGLAPENLYGAECLRIGFSVNSTGEKKLHADVLSLYKKAGVCVTSVEMPSMRLVASLFSGELDGIGWKIESFFEQHSQKIVALRRPIRTIHTFLLSKIATDRLGAKKPCVLSSQRGFAVGKKISDELGCTHFPVGTDLKALKMIELGRADAAAIPNPTLAEFIRENRVPQNLYIKNVHESKILHVLLKKHSKVLEKLNAASTELLK